MPSMIESVVMRKCNVSYKQSKQIVAMARDFLRLSPDSNLLWSKELENACILVYNSTNCEESVDAVATNSAPFTKLSLKKTKSSSSTKKNRLEQPVTKERKTRSLSKSRARKPSKSPTPNTEDSCPQSRSQTSEEIPTSSSHRRSSSRIRRLDEVSHRDEVIKSARNVQRLGESRDTRSTRPQRSVSEKSCNSKMSDRSQSSKSPSSSSSQKSKSHSVQNMDNDVHDLHHKEVSNVTSSSRRLSGDSGKQSKRTSSSQSKVPEVSRRPRSNSESTTEREKQSFKSSRKVSSTPSYTEPDLEQRSLKGSNTTNISKKSVRRSSSPESQSSRLSRTENNISRINLNQNDSAAMDAISLHQSSAHGRSTLAKTKVTAKSSHSTSRQMESKFLGSDDDSSNDSFACTSKPFLVRKLHAKEDNRQNEAPTPVTRRPRSPGPRIGANSEFNKSNTTPFSQKKSKRVIDDEQSEKRVADKLLNQKERKLNQKSVSPEPDERNCKKNRTPSSSPKPMTRLLSTNTSSVLSNTPTNKKSNVSRRRLSMEELAKACEADPGLRDAIIANFGKESARIRLGTYRAAPKAGIEGDEFTKSFEEWEEHNDDSSESTNAPSKSPALQQYTVENPLSTFIGKVSKKADFNKDENTVSTGSESSTKSKTRMIPVMKSTMSPAKKSSPKGGTMEPSSLQSTRIFKNTSHISLMSTDFEDPFMPKKNETPKKSRNRFIGAKSVDVAPKGSKVAGCSIGESVLSRTSNTTESTFSSSKDDSEEDIPIVDYAVPSFHDEYSEDQIFPEFSERFAKNNGLKRKESVRVSSQTDLAKALKEKASPPLLRKNSSSSGSSLAPPRLPQRKLSIAGSFR